MSHTTDDRATPPDAPQGFRPADPDPYAAAPHQGLILAGLETVMLPGRLYDVRCFEDYETEDGRCRNVYTWRSADPHRLAAAAYRFSLDGANCHLSLNPVIAGRYDFAFADHAPSRPGGRGAGTADIARRDWLLLDVEYDRPSETPTTDAEQAATLEVVRGVIETLAARGWGRPLLIDSGNGYHLRYRCDLPAEDDLLHKRVLRAAEAVANAGGVKVDQTVHNADRLARIAGTVNRKGAATVERPHRLCRLLDPGDGTVVPTELIEQFAATAPAVRPRAAGGRVPVAGPPRGGGGRMTARALDLFMAEHLPDADGPHPWVDGARRWVLPVCPWDLTHEDRAAFVVQFPGGGVQAGCHHDGCDGLGFRDLVELFVDDAGDDGTPPCIAAARARARRRGPRTSR